MRQTEAMPCHCHFSPAQPANQPGSVVGKTARSLSGIALAVLVAFFPKCPMCWAAYMSMFGSVWLARTPYMAWLFPVLLALFGVHLLLLLRRASEKGYAPFLLSLAGAIVILSGRTLFPQYGWIPIAGMVPMVVGSLLSSFSADSFKKAVADLTTKQGQP